MLMGKALPKYKNLTTPIVSFCSYLEPPKLNLGGKDVWDMNNQQKA